MSYKAQTPYPMSVRKGLANVNAQHNAQDRANRLAQPQAPGMAAGPQPMMNFGGWGYNPAMYGDPRAEAYSRGMSSQAGANAYGSELSLLAALAGQSAQTANTAQNSVAAADAAKYGAEANREASELASRQGTQNAYYAPAASIINAPMQATAAMAPAYWNVLGGLNQTQMNNEASYARQQAAFDMVSRMLGGGYGGGNMRPLQFQTDYGAGYSYG